MIQFQDRTTVGLVEEITIKQPIGEYKVLARIDTGATKSSIDINLTSELRLGPIVDTRVIKSANGANIRPMVEATVNIQGREIREKFTLADRRHMKYKLLIGQNILKQGFLIDPNKE